MNELKRQKIALAVFLATCLVVIIVSAYYTTYIEDPENFDPIVLASSFIGGMVGYGLEILLFRGFNNKKRVLIIYDKYDKEFVQTLSHYLSKNKTIVYDEDQLIKSGGKLTKDFRKLIVNIDSFIVVLSENLVLSDFLKRTISLAEEDEKKIIPIVKDNTAIPSFLSNYKPANFKRSYNGSPEFQHLLSAI